MPDNFLKEFKDPSSQFRGAPFWAWNCKLTKEKLLKQVEYFYVMGMGGFTIHCRTGLDTPYMSDEFLDYVKICTERAKELGMKVYLYDEDRWPSGYGGGEVTKEFSFRSRYLVFTPVPQLEQTYNQTGEGDSSAKARTQGNGQLLARYDITLKDGYLKAYRMLNREENGENVWYAYLEVSEESTWFNNQTYVDTLNKNAIKKFLETTHEKYDKTVGGEFGTTIPSIFTDEPQFVHKTTLGKAEEKKDIIIPYTGDFEESYQKEYGVSFLEHLPEIFWELPEGKVSVARYYYHDHVAERFARAFSDTVGEWCENHHIALTGHMMEEPTLQSQTAALGEAMRHYRGFHIPGIDMLCDWREYTTAKQAQSAAHQMGKGEVTSELYGVTNWDFTFSGHKLQGDWQAALGVTHRVHHLSWASMAGEAKRDYPASIFYQSPWYQKYKLIETYFARVNTTLQSGKPKVRVGVIHPIESYWLYYGPEEQTTVKRDLLERQFKQVTEWMLFGLVDFDFISESLILSLDEKESGSGFSVGEMAYEAVIIPGCVTLRKSTLDRLCCFIRSGGKVVIMGKKPLYVDAVPSKLPEDFSEQAVCIDFDYGQLMAAVEDYRDIDMKNEKGIRSDRYLYQLREDGENRILFLANGKQVENPDVPNPEMYIIKVKGEYQVTILDAASGESYLYPAELKNGYTLISRTLYDEDSLLLYLRKETGLELGESKGRDGDYSFMETLNTVHSFIPEEPNVLLLDQAEYAFDEEGFRKEEEVLRIDNILRSKLGYPLKGGSIAQPWTDKEEEKEEHQVKLRYQFESEVEYEQVKLAIEYTDGMLINLNGNEITAYPDGYYVDESIKTIPLPTVKKGCNILVITMPYTRKTDLEWCYLLGEFGVVTYGNRAKIVKKAERIGFSDLTAQTYPFYGGNMNYICDVTVEAGEYELEITKFRAPLLSVTIDEREAGNIMFSPYRVSLGHLSGKHRIQITSYGNRVNTFGPVHCCDENISWYGPNAWRMDGAQYSYEYQLKKTGILAAPKLYKKR